MRVRFSNHHAAYQQRPIPAAHGGPPAGTPPGNPVEARIFVLTDDNSGSALNSFLDEVLQFPHVELIGTAPLSGRRSCSPTPFPLPTGNFTLNVPAMVRIGRRRDEMQERILSDVYGSGGGSGSLSATIVGQFCVSRIAEFDPA